MRGKDALLLAGREAGKEREDLGLRGMMFAQGLGRFPDLAFTRKEDEDVAGAFGGQFVDSLEDAFLPVTVASILVFTD